MDSKTQYLKQIMYGVIVASSEFVIGIMLGWPAVLPRLSEAERSELQLTSQIEEYLISCVFICGLLTNLIAGFLRELFGPRTLVLLTLPAAILSFISQALFLNVWVQFAGRLVIGSITGLMCSVVQTLVAELCCPKIRGFLSSFPELFVSSGLLYAYVLAKHLPFRWVNGLCVLPTFLTLLFIPLVPESPYWLLSKGKMEKAESSVRKLYHRDAQREFIEIQDNIIPHSTFKSQVQEIVLPHNYKPIILVIIIFLLKDLAGSQFIFSYAGHLFEEADISFDSSWCPILIGMCRMTFTVISASTVDHIGRRPLLMSSAVVCGLTLFTAGVSEHLALHNLCLVAVLIFTASYSMGEGPIVWVILGELIPLPVRSQGSCSALILFFCSGFLTTFLYPKLSVWFGLDIVFYICALVHFILLVVVWEFLPETKNASLCDVKKAYNKQTTSFSKEIVEGIDNEKDKKYKVEGYDNFGCEQMSK